ncbi:Zinc carboxypeptidase [Caulifigura coniformis]|uniref:Zinc carboxypeptidase n=1 Tax=Caulifigura coniformis TaxID=2527983 RepID=A0A517SJZ0_9PLAN|nr:M14 family zinc carboxypeptidase [Caulifigura coniformis]QDT56437.1 Zinc carboxypeptidase [Caulifigura coniformis]
MAHLDSARLLLIALLLLSPRMARAQQDKAASPNPNRVPDVATDLQYIDTGFENASPLWYEVEPDNVIKVHLLYDHERDAPNRANLHFHFKIHARPGSKLTLEFDNLDNVWNRMKSPVSRELKLAFVSPDDLDDDSWEPVPIQQLAAENRSRLTVEMTGPVLTIARVQPYLLRHLDRMLVQLRNHGDASLIDIKLIGETVEGRDLEIVRIGKETAPYRVFLRARAHPWESGGNWVLQGLVNQLLSGDEVAQKALERYCVYFLPMANKDGVVRGRSRFNLRGRDLNRNWDVPADRELAPENHALEKWLEAQIAAGRKPHLALELHNDGNGKLHINRPPGPDGERHYDRMKILEELLRARTWFREGTSISPGGGGTLGAGWLTRYGIDGAVHELNCNWLEGKQDFPSRTHWQDYGANLVSVFDDYFATVKP